MTDKEYTLKSMPFAKCKYDNHDHEFVVYSRPLIHFATGNTAKQAWAKAAKILRNQ